MKKEMFFLTMLMVLSNFALVNAANLNIPRAGDDLSPLQYQLPGGPLVQAFGTAKGWVCDQNVPSPCTNAYDRYKCNGNGKAELVADSILSMVANDFMAFSHNLVLQADAMGRPIVTVPVVVIYTGFNPDSSWKVGDFIHAGTEIGDCVPAPLGIPLESARFYPGVNIHGRIGYYNNLRGYFGMVPLSALNQPARFSVDHFIKKP